jgi:hypothetical protein
MLECTSSHFAGLVAITDPKESWVAEWKRLEKKLPGCYCVSVDGEYLNEEEVSSDDEESEDEMVTAVHN